MHNFPTESDNWLLRARYNGLQVHAIDSNLRVTKLLQIRGRKSRLISYSFLIHFHARFISFLIYLVLKAFWKDQSHQIKPKLRANLAVLRVQRERPSDLIFLRCKSGLESGF